MNPVVHYLEERGYVLIIINPLISYKAKRSSLRKVKTDVKDAEWIAQLLRYGLLKTSFIPERNQRELRELVRYRRSIIEERARQHNRIQKVVEEYR